MSGAEYQRRYRANASLAWKEKEVRRTKAWWRAHRALAKKYPVQFAKLYAAEKQKLNHKEARS